MRSFAQEQKPTRMDKSASPAKPTRRLGGRSHELYSTLLSQPTGSQIAPRALQHDAEKLEADSADGASTRFAHDFGLVPIFSAPPVQAQPKLTVSTPGDAYEREADRVADQVMCSPEPEPRHAPETMIGLTTGTRSDLCKPSGKTCATG
jgi:hypothetical protein